MRFFANLDSDVSWFGFDSFTGLEEDWSGTSLEKKILFTKRCFTSSATECGVSSRLVYRHLAKILEGNR